VEGTARVRNKGIKNKMSRNKRSARHGRKLLAALISILILILQLILAEERALEPQGSKDQTAAII
jgi:hypothetical protein